MCHFISEYLAPGRYSRSACNPLSRASEGEHEPVWYRVPRVPSLTSRREGPLYRRTLSSSPSSLPPPPWSQSTGGALRHWKVGPHNSQQAEHGYRCCRVPSPETAEDQIS